MGHRTMSSQFSSGEVFSILVAWLVLSIAITYQNILGLFTDLSNLDLVLAGFVATATGFILHEMGHKFVAIRRGYVAHFRIWVWGIVLTLAVVTLSGGGLVFGAPGAVYIAPMASQLYGYDSGQRAIDIEEDNMLISAAGPGINLGFALGFLATLFVVPSGFLRIVAIDGLLLNVGLGSFNMLPIAILDGAKIFRKNIVVGLALALPLWALFVIFNFVL